jgi:hypothetical protein
MGLAIRLEGFDSPRWYLAIPPELLHVTMLLKFLLYAMTVRYSYNTEAGICHVARPNAQHVQVVCISRDAIVTVPNGFGGTMPSRLVDTYYDDGTHEQSVDPEIIEHVAGI